MLTKYFIALKQEIKTVLILENLKTIFWYYVSRLWSNIYPSNPLKLRNTTEWPFSALFPLAVRSVLEEVQFLLEIAHLYSLQSSENLTYRVFSSVLLGQHGLYRQVPHMVAVTCPTTRTLGVSAGYLLWRTRTDDESKSFVQLRCDLWSKKYARNLLILHNVEDREMDSPILSICLGIN